jgi:hypothetical protein
LINPLKYIVQLHNNLNLIPQRKHTESPFGPDKGEAIEWDLLAVMLALQCSQKDALPTLFNTSQQ